MVYFKGIKYPLSLTLLLSMGILSFADTYSNFDTLFQVDCTPKLYSILLTATNSDNVHSWL